MKRIKEMGCDIHQRTFLWSKTTRRYVGAGEVTEYTNNYDVVGDRYYDYFGLFGNTVRSCYPALDCLHFGLPDALPRTTKASFKHYGADYHTISWCLLPELYSSMTRYLDNLKNPAKFLIDDPENFQESLIELPEWKEDNSPLVAYVDKRLLNLRWLVESRQFEKIIDPDKTMFLIYFDN